MTNQKETFEPRKRGQVKMFVCGPTVYDHSHLGHARTYIFFDVVAKYLRSQKYKVKYLMNITDLDDRIIDKAQKENKSTKKIAREFEKSFMKDIKHLKVNSINKYARATDFIKQIVKQVKVLIKKDIAYKIETDGYYFDLTKFPDYGKLSHRTTEQAEDSISRIDEAINKRNKGDFALWKFSKPGEPVWDADFGQELAPSLPTVSLSNRLRGRPGWHIEDTAITEYFFGPQYDLHGGGVDLKFPHHEAEIAQQESASGKKPFVKYWLHTGFITVNGQKMSKSLNNFITIKEVLKDYSPEALRLMSLSAYYRSPIDYSEKVVKQFQAAVNKIYDFLNKLKLVNGPNNSGVVKYFQEAKIKFESAMSDDFSTASAIAVIFELINYVNPILINNSLSRSDAKKIKNFFKHANSILGIVPTKDQKIPKEILEFVKIREHFREKKNWEKADEVRTEIEKLGYQIEDTIYGPLITKKI